MSPSASRFQIVPYEIVEVIIGYTLPKNNTTNRKERLAIMHSCHTWRTVYMYTRLSSLMICCLNQTNAEIVFENMYDFVSPLIYPINRFVRTLTIYPMSWETLMSGEVLSCMQSSPVIVSTNFAYVKTLTIDANVIIKPKSFVQSKALDQAKNIAKFFRHIKTLAPNAKTVKMTLFGFNKWLTADKATNLIEKSIAELVYGRNFTVGKPISYGSVVLLNPISFSMLTSLFINRGQFDLNHQTISWVCRVCQHNATTLQSLELDSLDLKQLMMFTFKKGVAIIYSSLVKMNICIIDKTRMLLNSVNPISSRYSGKHTNHFPVLKYLKIDGPYIITIGCFFGPVNNSLEYLDANIYPEFPSHDDPNKPYPVDLTRFYCLKTIRFTVKSSLDRSQLHGHKECSDILKSFAGSSSAISYICMEIQDIQNVLKILNNSSLCATIRELDVRATTCSFAVIIKMLTGAPLLQNLVCGFKNVSPQIDGVDLIKHPNFLKKPYFPLGKYFSNLMVNLRKPPKDTRICNISWYVVLLATICPKLRDVKISYNHRKIIRRYTISENVCDNITKAAESLYKSIKH